MTSLSSLQFFGSLLGQRMLSHEQHWLKQQLRTCVGTHALLLTSDPYVSCKPLFSDFYCGIDITCHSDDDASVCASYSALPLPNASMDVVVLQHCLSLGDRAIDVVREAERVLVPGGRLFVINENPYSFLGLKRLIAKEPSLSRAPRRLYSAFRVQEWLAALDVPVQSRHTLFHELPIEHESLLARMRRLAAWCSRRRMPFGGVFCLAAIKTARPVTPIRFKSLVWQPSIASTSVAKTSVSRGNVKRT